VKGSAATPTVGIEKLFEFFGGFLNLGIFSSADELSGFPKYQLLD
jgi:hypothetical protein